MAKPATGQFGQWLRQWRRDNRYSLDQFAKLSGVSKVALFELEHGRTFNPRLATLMAISKATKVAFTRVAMLAALQKMQEGA
ncbi:helix-turn-helix domain-containing protein [Stenotrophomonas acidaminiphila]|uniref:helix-turn-helix domain-containing protein n=1 Tax=Stenotrophomonas acidaminiphila TaxID=128780 RepID=UPI0028AAA21B|nr:helix-turn-helix domain-containing protein [Stenotrophomonas acidaminiphila]